MAHAPPGLRSRWLGRLVSLIALISLIWWLRWLSDSWAEVLWTAAASVGLIWWLRSLADARRDVRLAFREGMSELTCSIALTYWRLSLVRVVTFALMLLVGILAVLAPNGGPPQAGWEAMAALLLRRLGAPALMLVCLLLALDGLGHHRERRRQLELAMLLDLERRG